jgi:hypothetical protein
MIIGNRSGRLRSLRYEAEGRRIENADYEGDRIRVSLNVRPGDPVREFVSGPERLGQAVFLGGSRGEILTAEAEFLRSLEIETED